MKKLLFKICILALLIVSFSLFIVLLPFLPNDPIKIHEHKQLLMARQHGKQIICIGGSGTFHSVSATLIEDQIKGYDAVNVGFNAGLGLRFNLNEIKPYIDADDIVLLIPEYHNYEGGYSGSVAALMAINNFPKLLEFIPMKDIMHLIASQGLQYIPLKTLNYMDNIGSYINNTYSKYNDDGDIIVRSRAKNTSHAKLDINISGKEYNDVVVLLNEFYGYCNKKKASVVLLFPAIPITHFEKEASDINLLYKALSRDVKMPILYSPDTSTYPEEYFHDTVYHMNSKGREIHTFFIIQELKKLYPHLNSDN